MAKYKIENLRSVMTEIMRDRKADEVTLQFKEQKKVSDQAGNEPMEFLDFEIIFKKEYALN